MNCLNIDLLIFFIDRLEEALQDNDERLIALAQKYLDHHCKKISEKGFFYMYNGVKYGTGTAEYIDRIEGMQEG